MKSETKLRNDRKSREKAIKKIEDKLIHIESRLNARKYKNPDYVEYMAKKSVEGSRTKKVLEEDEKLDGKYMLATNKDFDNEEETLIAYKGRDKIEKRISTNGALPR